MKFKFLSVRVIGQNARETFLRFPEPLIAALTAAILSWLVVQETLDDTAQNMLVILVTAMGISLFFALATFCETRKALSDKMARLRIVAMLTAAGILALLYFSHHIQPSHAFIWRFMEFFVATHLLVAFLPYLRGTEQGFWEFNQRLFSRFVFSAFFTGVLYAGLAVAMASIDYLLDFEFDYKDYLRVAIACGFVFNTWFFLAGVPKPLPRRDEPEAFPRNLEVFTKFLLIPLVTGYLLILYAYALKIGIQWTWPKGTVGYLVSAFSLLGIFALLLTHPIQQTTNNRWIRAYARGFYFALFPLVVMLLMGTCTRLGEYGVTERRYLLLVLGFWLAGIASYFSFSKQRDIRTIPVSLFVVILLTTVGPWSAYAVSYRSQLARLERLLEQSGVLVNGQLVKLDKPEAANVQRDRAYEISNLVDYVVSEHDGKGIEKWFSPSVQKELGEFKSRFAFNRSGSYVVSGSMLSEMGLTYQWYSGAKAERSFGFMADRGLPEGLFVDTAGYTSTTSFSLYGYGGNDAEMKGQWKGQPVVLTLPKKGSQLRLRCGSESVDIPLESIMAELPSKRLLSEQKIDVKGNSFAARLYFDHLSWRLPQGDKADVESATGILLLKRTK